jgi:hypothetical protein
MFRFNLFSVERGSRTGLFDLSELTSTCQICQCIRSCYAVSEMFVVLCCQVC